MKNYVTKQLTVDGKVKIPKEILDQYKTIDPEAHVFFKEFDEPEGAKILEVGSQHAPIASMLSTCGFQVTGVDLREADQNVNYLHVKSDFCALPNEFRKANLNSFDVAITVSTIEHFGINAYGEGKYKPYYDVIAMRHIYDFLKPGGVCYITVPFGGKFVEVNPHWRVYDWESFIERLVQDFTIEVFFTKVVEEITILGRHYSLGESIDILPTLFNMDGHPNISLFAKLRKT